MNSIAQDAAIEELQKRVEQLQDHLLRLSKEVMRLHSPPAEESAEQTSTEPKPCERKMTFGEWAEWARLMRGVSP